MDRTTGSPRTLLVQLVSDGGADNGDSVNELCSQRRFSHNGVRFALGVIARVSTDVSSVF